MQIAYLADGQKQWVFAMFFTALACMIAAIVLSAMMKELSKN